MSRFSRATLLFAVTHFIATMACTVTAFTLGMQRFDSGEPGKGIVESLSGFGAELLMTPGRLLWTPWASKNLPNLFEWLLLLANSLLWGFALALLVTQFSNWSNSKNAISGIQQ